MFDQELHTFNAYCNVYCDALVCLGCGREILVDRPLKKECIMTSGGSVPVGIVTGIFMCD